MGEVWVNSLGLDSGHWDVLNLHPGDAILVIVANDLRESDGLVVCHEMVVSYRRWISCPVCGLLPDDCEIRYCGTWLWLDLYHGREALPDVVDTLDHRG